MGTTTVMLATSSTPGARPRLQVLPGGVPPAQTRGRSRSPRAGGSAAGVPMSGVAVGPARRPRSGEAVRTTRPARRERVVPRDHGSRGRGGWPTATARVDGAAAARPVPARPVPARLRLTRRGRLVLRWAAVLLALVVASVLMLVLSRPASAGSQSRPVPARYHVVLPGETLWGIAGEVAPNADRRDVIAEIVELNALSGSGVSAGQRIALPPTS
jgi:hypothetical protein